jgi:hypothetical protein
MTTPSNRCDESEQALREEVEPAPLFRTTYERARNEVLVAAARKKLEAR